MGICDINVVGEQEHKSVTQNKQTKYNVCIPRVTIVLFIIEIIKYMTKKISKN